MVLVDEVGCVNDRSHIKRLVMYEIISAQTSARIQAASMLRTVNSELYDVRSLICWGDRDVDEIEAIRGRISALANKAMRVTKKEKDMEV